MVSAVAPRFSLFGFFCFVAGTQRSLQGNPNTDTGGRSWNSSPGSAPVTDGPCRRMPLRGQCGRQLPPGLFILNCCSTRAWNASNIGRAAVHRDCDPDWLRRSIPEHVLQDCTTSQGPGGSMSTDKCSGYSSGARLAQSVERKALNLVVVGSSPTVGVPV